MLRLVQHVPFDDVEGDVVCLRNGDGAFVGAAVVVIQHVERPFGLRPVGPFEAMDGGGHFDIGGGAFRQGSDAVVVMAENERIAGVQACERCG